MTREDEQFDQLPPAIVDALREFDGPAVMPDAERDADVLSGVRQHLAQAAPVDRKRRNLRLFFAGTGGGAIAAAAMIAFTVFISRPSAEQRAEKEMDMALRNSEPVMTAPPLPGDVNASGNLDILDAYTLARRVHLGQADDKANPGMDINGDGQVDQQDIDLIANRIVALTPAERS